MVFALPEMIAWSNVPVVDSYIKNRASKFNAFE
jgi:hypothetical protein